MLIKKAPEVVFDPQSLPIDGIAGEAPVPAERLTAQGLRGKLRCASDWVVEEQEEVLLRLRTRQPVPAAVLLPIVLREAAPTLLMTRRTDHLNDHAGQVSLPGGRVDPQDRDRIDTALREAEEEVGLQRSHLEVLATLPDYVTGTGFCVTPVVALAHPPLELCADPFEVAEIFEVPLAFLMDGRNHQRRSATFPDGSRRSFYTIPYRNYFIWGATAGMLRNLFHALRAGV